MAHLDKPLPCPFCGSNELEFVYNMTSGHGDSGFINGRIQCKDCSGSKGDASDYGKPAPEDVKKTWEQWNDRNIKGW